MAGLITFIFIASLVVVTAPIYLIIDIGRKPAPDEKDIKPPTF